MIQIRPAAKSDILLLTKLGRETFIESFSQQNNPVNVQQHLAACHVNKVIETEYKNPKNRFFVADYCSAPAGFFKIVFDEHENQPLLKGKKCLLLERIYVLQKYQGLNIAHKMLDKVLEIAAENQFGILWLGVWEKNIKAIKIYEKWGFEQFGTHLFNLGGDLQTDLLMKITIEPQKN